MNKRVLVLGAHGMLGHVVCKIFEENGNDVVGIALSGDAKKVFAIDVATYALDRFLQINPFDVVINCVGVLNEYAEQNPAQAIALNALLPHRLQQFYKNTGTKVIQPGTDCVFAGNTGPYYENTPPDGRKYYDRTKALGELVNKKDLTLRTSIVGPDSNENGIGLLNWFMKQKGNVTGYKNALWTGVTTLQLARGMVAAVKQNVTGLYHYVPSHNISKYDMLVLFKEILGKNDVNIIPAEEPRIDKSLVNTRKDFNHAIPNYPEMFAELGKWMRQHAALYPHYHIG